MRKFSRYKTEAADGQKHCAVPTLDVLRKPCHQCDDVKVNKEIQKSDTRYQELYLISKK